MWSRWEVKSWVTCWSFHSSLSGYELAIAIGDRPFLCYLAGEILTFEAMSYTFAECATRDLAEGILLGDASHDPAWALARCHPRAQFAGDATNSYASFHEGKNALPHY